ncbi:CLUMA_CG001927, isoform A [Clunio marinus]|uniref:CLUMA_CG001927, isoform A n=1 Tax=Clunio marinus TaxID=568069 RepID=A0A1J1HNU3_9DIPT|nr:CLUMA_CG001927, isoform A [Clunio marinus]
MMNDLKVLSFKVVTMNKWENKGMEKVLLTNSHSNSIPFYVTNLVATKLLTLSAFQFLLHVIQIQNKETTFQYFSLSSDSEP